MKKGTLALSVLSCLLLVGAPACNHKKDQIKSPPKQMKQQREKKQKAKNPDAPKKRTKKEPGIKNKKAADSTHLGEHLVK